MGSAVPGVWPQSRRSPCACTPQDTCIQEWVGTHCVQMGGHIQAGKAGDSCVLSPGSLLSLLGPGGPCSCQAQVQLDPQEEGGCQNRYQGDHLPAGWPSALTQAPVPLASAETCQEPWGSL